MVSNQCYLFSTFVVLISSPLLPHSESDILSYVNFLLLIVKVVSVFKFPEEKKNPVAVAAALSSVDSK